MREAEPGRRNPSSGGGGGRSPPGGGPGSMCLLVTRMSSEEDKSAEQPQPPPPPPEEPEPRPGPRSRRQKTSGPASQRWRFPFPESQKEVTKPGNWMDDSEGPTTVILGVTSSVPSLPLPNVLLMANVTWPQDQFSTWSTPGSAPVITLSRILPLKYVELRIYDRLQRILRVRTVTEKIYYLRLHEKHPETVFQFWIRLVKILQRGLSITTKDPRIRISHCLVPKLPCRSTETSESSLPSSSQPSESSMLLAAEQSGDRFLTLSGTSQLTVHRNTNSAIEIDNFNCNDNTSSPVSSPVISNIPMRATLSHSLWEQENADEYYIQAPVASSLGENFWGP